METPARIVDNDEDGNDDDGMMGCFMSSEEMFINDTDDHDDDDDRWRDIEELMQYDKLKYEALVADAEAEVLLVSGFIEKIASSEEIRLLRNVGSSWHLFVNQWQN